MEYMKIYQNRSNGILHFCVRSHRFRYTRISNNYLEVLANVMEYTCYVRSYATEFQRNRNKHHMRKQIEYEIAVSVRICYTLE